MIERAFFNLLNQSSTSTRLRLLSYHFFAGLQVFSIILAKFIIVYGFYDMISIFLSTFVICMQCAYMSYAGFLFDFQRVQWSKSADTPSVARATVSPEGTPTHPSAPVTPSPKGKAARGCAAASTCSQVLLLPACPLSSVCV